MENSNMNMEECITELIKRLKISGYNSFQLKKIINEAIGQDSWIRDNNIHNLQIFNTMKKYERLGNEYLQAYSK